jgi:protein-L-isoaspartate(D-aspartate) O-methyltransferase
VPGDGARVAFDSADIIYVNAGATKPAEAWLERLVDGGRLILPLTAAAFQAGDVRQDAVFRIARRDHDFLARRISGVAIFPCEGMRDAESEAALATAFEKGRVQEVTRLYRRDDVPKEDCWLRGTGWSLAYR